MKKLLVIASTLTVLLFTSQAHAAFALGADLKLGMPMGGGVSEMLEVGYGFDGRVGYNLSLAMIEVQPELVFSYMRFGNEGESGSTIYRGMAGGRAGLGLGLMPFVYAHIGYGSFSSGLSAFVGGSARTYDIGGGLDFTALPLINIGISAGYNIMKTDKPVEWFDLGVHANIVF